MFKFSFTFYNDSCLMLSCQKYFMFTQIVSMKQSENNHLQIYKSNETSMTNNFDTPARLNVVRLTVPKGTFGRNIFDGEAENSAKT